jgi:hypothetical protein
MEQQMEVRAKQVAKTPTLSGFKIVGSDNTGVWLSTGKAGSAIVEGGINGLVKVKPDGEFFAVMSDKHDFLENVPGLGKAAETLLPENLVAVTPPMYGNINAKRVDIDTPEYRLSSTEKRKPKEKGSKTDLQVLEGIAGAKPVEEVLRGEKMRNRGAYATAGGLLTQQDDETN